ncbi:MAG: DivIVA domain-containing protein [Acutalibacteraceae bacterium]|nr:DivIVA domain-containing protein [Acutalibacteraceae bacterium]
MLGSAEIRNVKFSKSMGGYKPDEVERLLLKIADDYEEFDDRTKKFQSKIEEMKAELEQLKKEKSSINNVLLSAQQLADKTVEDAKTEAEKIIASAKDEAENFEKSFASEKNRLEEEIKALVEATDAEKSRINAEYDEFVRVNNEKREAIIAECKKSVESEQVLFEKIKLSVAQFKKNLLDMYGAQTSLINEIPEQISDDPELVAKAGSINFDGSPVADKTKAEETAEEHAEEPSEEKKTFFKN